ncbi:MAG: STAS-like domain-containing protein [Nitrososphaerales archaeon]
MSNTAPDVINVAEKISTDLALRTVADDLFDWLESLPADRITLDFTGIRSISRSFAHQYVSRKKTSTKQINEINLPDNVAKMFWIVEHPTQNHSPINLDSTPVVRL